MRRTWLVGLIVGALVGGGPVQAGGPAKEPQVAKQLVDAYGRVWPTGVPDKRKYREYHPDPTKHRPWRSKYLKK